MTPFQSKLCEIIKTKALNSSMHITELAYRAKSNRLAVSSAMRSLEKQGRAAYIRSGEDQWAGQMWYLKGD